MAKPSRPVIDAKMMALIEKVTGKRPRTVLDHIVKHGHITTEDLASYGYNHPPRAARDVREAGVPLETFRVTSSDGRSIGAYRLGNPDAVQHHKLAGRSVLPKELLDELYIESGGRCFGCYATYEKRYLQIDHRVPYEIVGEPSGADRKSAFMLLCGTCQRKKSWSCEHCPNWEIRDERLCAGCCWVTPESYTHIATEPIRRIELTFRGTEEVQLAQRLHSESERDGVSLGDYIKKALRS